MLFVEMVKRAFGCSSSYGGFHFTSLFVIVVVADDVENGVLCCLFSQCAVATHYTRITNGTELVFATFLQRSNKLNFVQQIETITTTPTNHHRQQQ